MSGQSFFEPKRSAFPFGAEKKWQKILRPITVSVAVLMLILCGFFENIRTLFCVLGIMAAGWEICWGTYLEIRKLNIKQYTLYFLAIIIVFFTGHPVESVFVTLIASLGLWLYRYLREIAGQDIFFYDNLLMLRARIRMDNHYEYREVEKLAVGTVIEVFSGEVLPADGEIVAGGGSLDYSSWMHKQKSVPVVIGMMAYSGAVNCGQSITLKVTAAGKATLAQKMKMTVDNDLRHPATIQTVLNKSLLWMKRGLWALALIVAVLFPLFGILFFKSALYTAAMILLLADTGFLLRMVDLSFAVGMTSLSRHGALLKSCRQVTLLRRITDIIFSKTGTLTERNFRVEEVVPHNEYTKEQLLRYASTAQQVSDHLIATAILRHADGIELPVPEHHLVVEGEGVCVFAEGKRIFAGNDLLMRRAGIEVLPYHGQGMVCFVGVEDTYIGCIILHDNIKTGASKAIDGLFSLGIRSIDIVTGDKRQNAENIGAVLGVHRVFAEQSAEEKQAVVARNIRKGKYGGRLAFVGEESDEECMRSADISFSMRSLEDTLEGSVGDICIISDDPICILQCFRLSFKLRRVITVMLAFSFLLKIVALVCALGSLASLWMVMTVEVIIACFGAYLANSCRKLD